MKKNTETVLPEFLLPYKKEAMQYIARKLTKDIEFSSSTYQIEVEDPKLKEGVWAFLQLDQKGEIKDCFCSCENNDSTGGCVHIAAAYLRIFNNNALPLHQRFEKSLWKCLCQLYADLIGCEPHLLTKKKNDFYEHRSPSSKLLFSIQASSRSTRQQLHQIMEERQQETEETSLKFSNLSQSELQLWREGRPSFSLRYELSIWNDLAKWMMLMQDTDIPYTISFEYSPEEIPNRIAIAFPDLILSFYLSEANLPKIIPALSTVKSPLVAHNAMEDTISKITYDQKKGYFNLHTVLTKRKDDASLHTRGRVINGWIFIPNKGFFAREKDNFLEKRDLQGDDIAHLFDHYPQLVQDRLIDYSFSDQAMKISYQMKFDNKWNLHITGYVFEPGDLTKPHSKRFGNWIFLQDNGFYRIGITYFDWISIVIPAQQIPDFINLHRPWLNTQEGFNTHIISVETRLKNSLSKDNQLTFHAESEGIDEGTEQHDFGGWIYVKDFGFYSKTTSQISLPVQLGLPLNPEEIPLFIRNNEEELQLIPHFFSSQCPIKRSSLKIELIDQYSILISPEYEMLPSYENKEVRLFDEYTYVPGEGFALIPPSLRLPERFRHPVEISADAHNNFLLNELPAIRKYVSELDPQLVSPKNLSLIAQQIDHTNIGGQDTYSIKMVYQSEYGEINTTQVWKGISQKQRFLFSPAGLLDLDNESFSWLKEIDKSKVDQRSNKISQSTIELIKLNAFQELLPPHKNNKNFEAVHNILQELKEFKLPEPPDLTDFHCTLRPYQERGVHWLWFLYRHRLSGLLCDDMGLGKTHQAMALIAAIQNFLQKKGSVLPPRFLVICPTSVIFHWEDKLQKFLPSIHVHTYYGMERSMTDVREQEGVLLTSYGIWKRDAEMLKTLSFELVILDEIQVAKNHNSLIHTSLLNLHAPMKLGLTGTPIENRLRELKSLFDLVLPSYMPSETQYNNLFVKPIEKENHPERRILLMRFITPFVLRRKKEDVLYDLPEKTEEVAHCALLPDQHSLYQQVLSQSRTHLLQELHQSSNPIPYIHIFALLSSLKQICDHPSVYLKQPDRYREHHSGKWDLFLELLHEARESRQKVVIFSQYLMMIDIIENYLKDHQIDYATIRGSTVDRAEQLRKFNTDPECEVFIGSLQAAGLGIDLTAASVVIHYDRWWNAARERQATDRVHRIGQTRGVQVFKLVTKGTFEERIDKMIERKGKLMEDVIGTDEENIVKHFNRNELIELLEDVQTYL
jgi:SNF2 family DNA or RNA helicase